MSELIKNIFPVFAVLIGATLNLTGCSFYPSQYSAEAISGVVVDKSTGQSLPGAVVVVTWYSQNPGLMESPGRKIFEIQEAVTDAQGHYFIPGWQSKKLNRSGGSVDIHQPEILVYKYGYKPVHRENICYQKNIMGDIKPQHGSIIRWCASTEISIELLLGTQREKIEIMKHLEIGAVLPISTYTCDWKKMVNYILEMDKQFEENEHYYAELYKANGEEENKRTGASTAYETWYLRVAYPPIIRECPSIIEILPNARKSRSKNTK